MKITEVRKKRYILTPTETSVIREVLRVLSEISNDDDICENIQSESCAGVGDAENLLVAILSLDETDLDC